MFLLRLRRLPLVLLVAVGLLAACNGGGGDTEPGISEISVQPSEILVGGTATLGIEVSGGVNYQYLWTAGLGNLSDPPTNPFVIYTAPNSPGTDTVSVEITIDGRKYNKNLMITVVGPTATPVPEPSATPAPTVGATDVPAATPEPTPAPEVIACNHAAVATDLFPYWASAVTERDRWVFVGFFPEKPEFECKGVYDRVHSGQLAVRLAFKIEAGGQNYAFWGFGNKNGIDASAFNDVCFWAYTEIPNQVFWLQLKDMNAGENDSAERVQLAVAQPGEWTQFCTQLSKFTDLGVDTSRLRDVSLGFDMVSQNAVLWVDDFELK